MDHLREHLATLQGTPPSLPGVPEAREPTTLDGVVSVAAAMTKLCASGEHLASTLAGRLTTSPVSEVAKQYQVALKEIGLEGTREASQLVANVSTLYEQENAEADKSVETSIEALLLILQSQYHFFQFASEQLSRFAHAQSPVDAADQQNGKVSTASSPPPIPTRPKIKQRSSASPPAVTTPPPNNTPSMASPRGLRKHISLLFSRLGSKSSQPAEPRSSFFVQLGEPPTPKNVEVSPDTVKLSDVPPAPPAEKAVSGIGASEAELDTVINLLSRSSTRPPPDPLSRPPPPPGPPPPPSFPPPPLPQHLTTSSRAVGSQRRATPPGGSAVNHSYRGIRSQLHHQHHSNATPDVMSTAAKTNTWPSKVHRLDGAHVAGALPSSDAGILLATGNNPWSVLEAEMPNNWPSYANDGAHDYGSLQWSTTADSSSGSDASSSTTDQPWTSYNRQRESQSEDIAANTDENHSMVTAGQPFWNVNNAWNVAPHSSWGEVEVPSTSAQPWSAVQQPY